MNDRSLFISFWTAEARTTRTVFGRIPDGSTYRPDPKSRTAQQIAWQIMGEEKMLIEALETGVMKWAPDPMPASMSELTKDYERHSADLIGRWNALSDERWGATIDLFGSPQAASLLAWNFLFDVVHHRGQITTYLRPMGSTVPRIYGPSGDEP